MKTTQLMLLVTLACISTALAVDPSPDGGYPNQNTAEGENALFSLTDGGTNTGLGFEALYNNTNGFSNTAVGASTLQSNTTGFSNTAIGAGALLDNTAGFYNTAVGASALRGNTTGTNNTASGLFALDSNTVGDNNTANGVAALFVNTTGDHNTAVGSQALESNLSGNGNTVVGYLALSGCSGCDGNIAIGQFAGLHLTGGNNIDIGNQGRPQESKTIRIGTKPTHENTYIAGISGVTVAGGVAVIVDATGHLGTVTSSARYKEAIQPMGKASKAILALQPVTYHYKHELDPQGIPQFGLVAEQVAKVDPDLVARDAEGKPYAVRYEAVNAMLLNEFLKAHATIDELKSVVAKQEEQITALASQIEMVSNRLDLSQGAAQVVASEP